MRENKHKKVSFLLYFSIETNTKVD